LIAVALSLVLIAAVFHAGWNVLLKAQADPLTMARGASVVSAVIWAPIVLVAWLWAGRPPFPATAWTLAGISAVLELIYFVFLSIAYRRGTLSSVYSIARGTAPLLAVLAGVLILRERLTIVEIAGVGGLIIGLWLVRQPRAAGAATLPALLTGVTIAAYSAVDSEGVHAAAPWLYGFIVWSVTAAMLAVAVPVARTLVRVGPPSGAGDGEEVVVRSSPTLMQAAVVGLLMTSTYLLILIALRLAPLAIVSPLRESAIVLVTLWGVWKLGERDQVWLRLGGAAMIAGGAALVALG
jgi:drug/metabolite transporter (DMT)-like permease